MVRHALAQHNQVRLVMALTISDAIDGLYDVAITQNKSQSPARLKVLSYYCIEELAARGLHGAVAEQDLPGGGRTKNWDVAWEYEGKYRLAISLKSILKNIPGTVPNRIDDLIGEVANAQLYSPEIVIGYIMILDVASDAYSPKHKSTWAELLRFRLNALSGRRPPSWAIGTIEEFVLAEVNFSVSRSLLSNAGDFDIFFDRLATEVRKRNPNALRDSSPRRSQ